MWETAVLCGALSAEICFHDYSNLQGKFSKHGLTLILFCEQHFHIIILEETGSKIFKTTFESESKKTYTKYA